MLLDVVSVGTVQQIVPLTQPNPELIRSCSPGHVEDPFSHIPALSRLDPFITPHDSPTFPYGLQHKLFCPHSP